MTKIVVDVEALRRMVDWLSASGEDMSLWGKSLLNATSDARSYDGQYAPWVQALADGANHDIYAYIHEVKNLSRRLEKIAKAFEDADQAELAGDFAWALIMREMVERGEIPTGDWFQWRQTISRPPWISPAVWRRLNREERAEIVLAARRAYDAQNERIARMRTPPWEKDEDWLWRIIGLNPDQLAYLDPRNDGRREAYQDLLDRTRAEYEQHWTDFLEKQAVFKFGVGDDLTEAFLIYMFGLEGAAEYGVGQIVVDNQRLLDNPQERLREFAGGGRAQYINLDRIPNLNNQRFGVDSGERMGIHFNLCGELTSAITIGVDPIEALIRFDSINIEENGVVFTDGSAILEDHTMGTDAGDLSALLREYGWQGDRVGNTGDPYPWRDHRSWQPKPDQVMSHLDEGRAVIALVNLDTTSTLIEPVNNHTDSTHWVSILQVVQTRDGKSVVRIYNPYENREEWYPFYQLVESWTPGPNYRAVVATPPEELRWLPNP